MCITLPYLGSSVRHLKHLFCNILITRFSYKCSNLCRRKPLETAVFQGVPLAAWVTWLIWLFRLDPIHPTYPTFHLAQSLGRTQTPSIPHRFFWLWRTDAVLHQVESKRQGHPLSIQLDTSMIQAQNRSSTYQNLATPHAHSL